MLAVGVPVPHAWLIPFGGIVKQVREDWGSSRHDGGALKESARHYRLLLRLCYFDFDGERNCEIDFLRVLAIQMLDFSGFVFRLY